MLQENFDFDFHQSPEIIPEPVIVIGYYKLRGKAQVPRLLCQYLNIDYKDQLYTLADWDKYKRSRTKNWDFPDLPYLKEGDFIVSDPTPMCVYLINRFGNPELLGKTLNQKTIVKMYIWTIETMGNVININCQKKTPEQLIEMKKNQWNNNVSLRLKKYQELAKDNDWFLGYFTLVDLSIYELVRYMELIFPGEINEFPKLLGIKERVAVIPRIKQYEESARAVRQTDPTTLLDQLRKTKSTHSTAKS